MKLGCCLNIEAVYNNDAKKIMEAGYSYIELPLIALTKLDEDEYIRLKKAIEDNSLRVDSFNLFLPAEIKLVGDTTDIDAFTAYLDIALKRAYELGAKILVFGSGRSRNVPEGFPRDKAWEQLIALFRLASDKARAYDGLTIVIEPLNKKECNIINTIEEGHKLATEVDRDNIKLLADYYHMALDNEPISNIVDYGSQLRHTHFADPDGRVYPSVTKDEFVQFFGALKKINYTGRISMECSAKDLTVDAAVAYNILKELI